MEGGEREEDIVDKRKERWSKETNREKGKRERERE